MTIRMISITIDMAIGMAIMINPPLRNLLLHNQHPHRKIHRNNRKRHGKHRLIPRDIKHQPPQQRPQHKPQRNRRPQIPNGLPQVPKRHGIRHQREAGHRNHGRRAALQQTRRDEEPHGVREGEHGHGRGQEDQAQKVGELAGARDVD